MINVGNGWQEIFDEEQNKPYYLELRQFLKKEYSTKIIYPPMHEIFTAFTLTSFDDVKVVIVGQDPYHEAGQAMGLSFAVRDGIEEPPSLKNIKEELRREGFDTSSWSSDLSRWSRQGVLLINSTLTVEAHRAGSHFNKGWEIFTDRVIAELGQREKPVVFILWGSFARSKKVLIKNPRHLVLESPHPSPLSAYRGFFGNNHFRTCNEYLVGKGLDGIDW